MYNLHGKILMASGQTFSFQSNLICNTSVQTVRVLGLRCGQFQPNTATRWLLVLLSIIVLSSQGASAEPQHKDVEYGSVNGHRLLLDVYLPQRPSRQPLLIWVHGGAWRAGSKDKPPVTYLLQHGFVICSVDYRLSPVARFPANVHDIKAAIRFMRANAKRYSVDPNRVFIAGNSAGGHLAALVGVSNGTTSLEGSVGIHLDQSSDVQGIVSFYGASNLQTILSQSTPHGLSVRIPALDLLLGGQPDQLPDLARQASPVAHVDDKDPPLMLIHGDQDPQMPINQAHELYGRYLGAGRPAQFVVVYGGLHGGKGFFENDRLDQVAEFLYGNEDNSGSR